MQRRRPIIRPHRYQVNDEFVLRLLLQRAAGLVPETVHGELREVSLTGAKLRVFHPLSLGEAVHLQLHDDELDLHLGVRAEVKWAKQGPDESWSIGCSFELDLPRSIMERMFSHGLLNRRRARRHSIRGQALALWELNPQETQVGLMDLSSGGFSLVSPLPATPGSRIRLLLDAANGGQRETVPAIVQWQMEGEGGYLLGCTFGNPYGASAIRQWLASSEGTSKTRKIVEEPEARPALSDLWWNAVDYLRSLGMS